MKTCTSGVLVVQIAEWFLFFGPIAPAVNRGLFLYQLFQLWISLKKVIKKKTKFAKSLLHFH